MQISVKKLWQQQQQQRQPKRRLKEKEGKAGKIEEGVPRGKGALTGLGVELVESDCLGAVWGGLGPLVSS